MNIPNKILSILEAKIKCAFKSVCIIKDEDGRIAVVLSGDSVSILNAKTNLVWKREGEKIYLDSGYIVLEDEVEDDILEMYYYISNDKLFPGMMFSSLIYRNGKIDQDIDWEPDVNWCDIRFEKYEKGGKLI